MLCRARLYSRSLTQRYGAAVLLRGASEVLTRKVHWQALRGAVLGWVRLRACPPHQERSEVSSARTPETQKAGLQQHSADRHGCQQPR